MVSVPGSVLARRVQMDSQTKGSTIGFTLGGSATCHVSSLHIRGRLRFVLLLILIASSPHPQIPTSGQTKGAAGGGGSDPTLLEDKTFRLECLKVTGGTELLTIFARFDWLPGGTGKGQEVPLVSLLRDTLGDSDPANNRLRYLWMLTYTRPSLIQRLAAGVPFLYKHTGGKRHASKAPACTN